MASDAQRPNGLYPTIEDWLCEIEGFSLRIERMPDEATPWVETAWQLATRAEAYRCATICRKLAEAPTSPPAARELLAKLADEISATAPAAAP